MSQKFIIFLVILTLFFLFSFGEEVRSGAGLFPEINGWKTNGSINTYTPDNLFEYINGAAEVFLNCDFRKLYSRAYESKADKSVTADIYLHSSINNGFGIYSQEKPEKGEFIKIGTQGYYEHGVLNFFKGKYYVKLSSFNLGDKDRELLLKFASGIAMLIKDDDGFPIVLQCFPQPGKLLNSERYIATDFLGHSFLHSAFIAVYQLKGKKIKVFIIQSKSAEEAQTIINNYFAFIRKKGETIQKSDSGTYFSDPYYRSEGPMNMMNNGEFIWGMFHLDRQESVKILKEINSHLKKYKLIK